MAYSNSLEQEKVASEHLGPGKHCESQKKRRKSKTRKVLEEKRKKYIVIYITVVWWLVNSSCTLNVMSSVHLQLQRGTHLLHQCLTQLLSLGCKLNSLQQPSPWIQNYPFLYNLSIICHVNCFWINVIHKRGWRVCLLDNKKTTWNQLLSKQSFFLLQPFSSAVLSLFFSTHSLTQCFSSSSLVCPRLGQYSKGCNSYHLAVTLH